MNVLSCGEESMTICAAVLIQYIPACDGRTYGQTDVQPIYLRRASAWLTQVETTQLDLTDTHTHT